MTNNILTRNLSMMRPAEHYMVDANDNKAKFRVEPLQKGFGVTLGNSLRRIMLSSIAGSAVIGVRIDGIEHEYSTINGVKEDVMDIILNLKSLVIINDSSDKQCLTLKVSGKQKVTAGMISHTPGVIVVNKDAVICNITDPNVSLTMDIYIANGYGYTTFEENQKLLPQIATYGSVIGIDSSFSPVTRVAFNVETYYSSVHDKEQERLFFTVETNGSVKPDVAIAIAAKILQEQVQAFIGMNIDAIQDNTVEHRISFDPRLLMRVENMDLSVRSQNCLKNENIIYVGDLVTKSEVLMLKTPNFGRKSLSEIKEVLARMNLGFDMEVPGWPPEGNIEELSRRFEENT